LRSIVKTLQTSKTLNYLDHPLVGPYFAFFIFAWCYLRHYLNLRILYSEFNEFKTVGPYELNWETEQYKCWISHYISTALLASLQALNIFWLFYILRIAYRFVFAGVAEDDRSDNDENEFAEEQRLDALASPGVGVDHAAGPKVLVNGQPINGKSSSTQIRTDKMMNRKENRRKA
jgi:acyl-CoA-dependent ceramide synthase